MGKLRRIIALGAFTAAIISPSVKAATIVNVSATTASGSTLFLDAGTYLFSFIGQSAGGAYNAFSYWTDSPRWAVNVALDLGDVNGAFNRANTLSFSPVAGSNMFDTTAELASARAISAGLFSFSLDQSKSVNFFVRDSIYADNRGGVSLALTGPGTGAVSLAAAVPETSTWAMMIVGLGAVGAAFRRNRRRPAVSAA